MIVDYISYDCKRDLSEVVPGLSVDLAAALRSGVIVDAGVEVDYNGLDNVESIGSRVEDIFEAMDQRNKILSSGKKSNQGAAAPVVNPEAGAEQ